MSGVDQQAVDRILADGARFAGASEADRAAAILQMLAAGATVSGTALHMRANPSTVRKAIRDRDRPRRRPCPQTSGPVVPPLRPGERCFTRRLLEAMAAA